MPRVRKQPPQLDPSVTYVAWQGFSADVNGVPLDVPRGTRLRGDHPTVQATWWNWLPDGHDTAEQAARFREIYPEADWRAEQYSRPKPPPPLRDEDALVCIRPVLGALSNRGEKIAPGVKVPKDHPAAQRQPDAFVPVVPPGLSRDDAVVAKYTITAGDQVVVHAGQWLDRRHFEVERHPSRFELPGLEGTTLERSRHAKKVKE
jgi:hypothetical protein